ncbi:hypothetical protein [Taklimakanibacter albus]|uniref:Uncharacterized protein n=1 Tax=Taklimakanibacter albus TaxID=2800327 RepID=A0ACC5R6F9_9HYPH|nr:hypothetical protein [Aestuariivirga sp. YIM B02566]MBK1868250.1 hypothetical protein [Aestuariivirga sp. YIM B02566]
MPINDRTPNRDYPQPHASNTLADDVERLRQAFNALDADVQAVILQLGLKAALSHVHEIAQITGLQEALDSKMTIGATFSLNDLTDVNVAVSENGQILGKSGSQWIPVGYTWGNLGGKPNSIEGFGIGGGTFSQPVIGVSYALDAGAVWKLVGTSVTMNYDTGDFESFSRTNNLKQLTIGSAGYYAWTAQYQYQRYTDDGAGSGPDVYLDRQSSSPAANDSLAAKFFQGRNSAAETINYATMRAQIVDPVDATEDGRFAFETIIGGAIAYRLYIGAGLYAAGQSDPGAGKANFAGVQIAGTEIGSNSFGARTISTAAPTGGNDGDIHYQVDP